MRAASQRADPNDARIIQRYEEEESANKFLSVTRNTLSIIQ